MITVERREMMKALKGITLASASISVLYIALAAFFSFTEVSFRAWADVLGQAVAALVTPLLLVTLLLLRLWNNERLTDRCKLVIILLTLFVCMGGAMLVSLLIALNREEETALTKHLIVIEESYSVNDSHLRYYRPAGPFFKKADQLTDTDKVDYLCEKYGLEFILDEESGRIYEPLHPEITVTVHQYRTFFTDDYMEELTFHYLKEGCEVLGLKQEYFLSEKGKGWSNNDFYLIGKNLGDLPALSKDILLLANYCITTNGGDSEENIYHRYPGRIRYGFSIQNEPPCCVYSYSFSYGQLNLDDIKEETLKSYQEELSFRKTRDQKAAAKNEDAGNTSEAAGANTSPDEESEVYDPDYREKPAKMIYDAFLAKEGFSYEVCYNAKGNFYLDLGSKEEDGQLYHYRLVYDRPSKNGLCELFVLYRAEEGADEEAIVDMYAAEPDTGEVVRSGRKAWSDVGTKAYRDLTGE